MSTFQEWLTEKRDVLARLYDSDPAGDFNSQEAAGIIAQEASERAARHRLPELMQVWPDRAEIPDVDRYLVECLKSVEKPPAYVTREELAKLLGICVRSLDRRRHDKGFPQPMKVGRRVVWSVKELRDYGINL